MENTENAVMARSNASEIQSLKRQIAEAIASYYATNSIESLEDLDVLRDRLHFVETGRTILHMEAR